MKPKDWNGDRVQFKIYAPVPEVHWSAKREVGNPFFSIDIGLREVREAWLGEIKYPPNQEGE